MEEEDDDDDEDMDEDDDEDGEETTGGGAMATDDEDDEDAGASGEDDDWLDPEDDSFDAVYVSVLTVATKTNIFGDLQDELLDASDLERGALRPVTKERVCVRARLTGWAPHHSLPVLTAVKKSLKTARLQATVQPLVPVAQGSVFAPAHNRCPEPVSHSPRLRGQQP